MLAAPPPLFDNVTEETCSVMGLITSFKVQLGRSDAVLYLAFDTVLNFTGDAIVNVANKGCLGGGGIDGEVNYRGGHELEEARCALPLIGSYKRCEKGDAEITVAGSLPCSKVIHAVGPRFGFSEEHEADLEVLENAYKNSMERACENQMKSVGFCILSAGIFRGSCPLKVVIKTGLDAIAKHAYPGGYGYGSITITYPGLETVVFCGFTQHEQTVIRDIVEQGL